MNNCIQHVRDILGRKKNKRLYIGPGRDGSSYDKISVDVKFDSRSTKPIMPENKFLRSQGCVKTSFGYELDTETQTDTRTVIEDQVDMDNERVFMETYAQMVVIIHPMFSTAENEEKPAQALSRLEASCEDGISSGGTAKVEAIADPSIDHSPTQEETDKHLEEEEEEANYDVIDQADL